MKEKHVISSAGKSGQRRDAVIISKHIDAMDAGGVLGGVSWGVVSVGGACPAPGTPTSSSCSRKPEAPVTGETGGGEALTASLRRMTA